MSLIFNNGKLDKLVLTTRLITLNTDNENDWNLSGNSVIICNLDTAAIFNSNTGYLSVTGISAGVDGEIKIIVNSHGVKRIGLLHNRTESSEPNRIFLPNNSLNYAIDPRASVILMYSTSVAPQGKWVVLGEGGERGGASTLSAISVGGGGP